jgi:Glycosyltransferase family 87
MEVLPGGSRAGLQSPPSSLGRKIAAGAIIAAGIAFVVTLYSVLLAPHDVAERDYIEYWAAGQQLAHHANPYDVGQVLQIERGEGFMERLPRISFSPPVALGFALPLGYVSAKTGLILWLVAMLGCLPICVGLLSRLHGSPDSSLTLVGYVFVPTLSCIMAGQLGIFFLLLFLLFLSLYRTHPFWAGALMMPFALKPHLFVLFGLLLLIWCVQKRRLQILAGFGSALAVSSALSLYLDPHAWMHYRAMMQQMEAAAIFVPTLGVALRMLIHPQSTWLAFVPEALACVWAVYYYRARAEDWNWLEDGGFVLMVSVLVAPYAWYFDQTLFLPAVLTALYRARHSRTAIALFAVIQAASLAQLFAPPKLHSPVYLWQGPILVAWTIYAMRVRSSANYVGAANLNTHQA